MLKASWVIETIWRKMLRIVWELKAKNLYSKVCFCNVLRSKHKTQVQRKNRLNFAEEISYWSPKGLFSHMFLQFSWQGMYGRKMQGKKKRNLVLFVSYVKWLPMTLLMPWYITKPLYFVMQLRDGPFLRGGGARLSFVLTKGFVLAKDLQELCCCWLFYWGRGAAVYAWPLTPVSKIKCSVPNPSTVRSPQ